MKNLQCIIWSLLILLLSSCAKEDLLLNDKKTSGKAEVSSLTSINFDRKYGGTEPDYSESITTSKDGGYVIAGRSYSNDGDIGGNRGYFDGFLIKIDKNGNKLWGKNYGGSGSDVISSIAATQDGGYIFTGSSDSRDGDLAGQKPISTDVWVVKVDNQGAIQWSKIILKDSSAHWPRTANSIIQTVSGDYILAGQMDQFDKSTCILTRFGWFCKLNGSGNLVWEKLVGDVYENSFKQVVEDKKGVLWLVGTWHRYDYALHPPQGDVWLVKAGSDGNIAWEKKYGGSLIHDGKSIAIDRNNQIVLAGITSSPQVYGALAIKVDMNGETIWQKPVKRSRFDEFSSVVALLHGGYLLAGRTLDTCNTSTLDGWLVKLNDSGTIETEKTYKGVGSGLFTYIAKGDGDNYVVGGTSFSPTSFHDIWVVGFNQP